MKRLKIVCIGSGNVATHLAKALYQKKHLITQVWSRKNANAKKLATQVNADYTGGKTRIKNDGDLYLVCLPDSHIHSISEWLPFKPNADQIFVHTSGSIPSFQKSFAKNNGVFYPLQSFNKKQKVNLKEVPFFINSNNEETFILLEQLAGQLSKTAVRMSDKKRKQLHLSAVILNNFINHLAYKSESYLIQNDLKFEYLTALLDTTLNRVKAGNTSSYQTGPAKRNDHTVIKEHLHMLKDDTALRAIYKTISDSIIKTYQ